MKIIDNIRDCDFTFDTAVTVGKFDGIHRGHHLLYDYLAREKEKGLKSVVVSFDLSPRLVLSKDSVPNLITEEEKEYILDQSGIDYLVRLSFSEELMHMEAEDFVRLLSEKLHMAYMVVGSDFHFGYRGLGDTALLSKMAENLGFRLDVVSKIKLDKRDISSTYVRDEISLGHIERANELLGYKYFIWGEIVHGNHIGSGMGIPTINMLPPSTKLLPPNGVYITEVLIKNRTYHGVTNVGIKPTIEGTRGVNVETFILDFKEDVYEEIAKVSFLKRIRPEKKFNNLSELKDQILKDTKEAYHYFNL